MGDDIGRVNPEKERKIEDIPKSYIFYRYLTTNRFIRYVENSVESVEKL